MLKEVLKRLELALPLLLSDYREECNITEVRKLLVLPSMKTHEVKVLVFVVAGYALPFQLLSNGVSLFKQVISLSLVLIPFVERHGLP